MCQAKKQERLLLKYFHPYDSKDDCTGINRYSTWGFSSDKSFLNFFKKNENSSCNNLMNMIILSSLTRLPKKGTARGHADQDTGDIRPKPGQCPEKNKAPWSSG